MDDTVPFTSWTAHIVTACSVGRLRVRDKRSIFAAMRNAGPTVNADTLLCRYGVTCGEFAVYQVVTESDKKRS